ncbi:sensor histidine kinase [Rathayibacter sp. KR2-224]|uniref:sensor histidine kinase n=1 Tax=Rathayibacter sp. KR2-224 TaxID=3400913 RepID=UPI003BFB171F
MLSASELLLIAGTTIAATAAVSALTFLVLCVTRRAPVAARLAIVLAGSLLSIVASALAVAAEMYLSDHDVVVLAWVIGISAVLTMTAAWAVARVIIKSSIQSILASTRRVGRGDIVPASPTGLRELDAISVELAETSERLAEARAQVAELDHARKQFFAWISHDLRTPLTGMRAMAEAIEEGTAPDPAGYMRAIRAKVDTVNQMVGDLFELSKMQTGTLELRPEPVVLLDLVSDAVSDVQAIAAERGIRIAQDGIDGHLIWADPRELTRAIVNLLANGVRHAPAGTPILIRADTLEDQRLILSVIDQGPGVEAENLGRMFDVGWRADTSRTSTVDANSGGAGLGLAIVRGIVEAHGGQVQARHTQAGFHLDVILPAQPQQT